MWSCEQLEGLDFNITQTFEISKVWIYSLPNFSKVGDLSESCEKYAGKRKGPDV